MIGRQVSHYKILSKLGEGGMGVVYKAEDLKLHRFVALKFLPPHTSHDDARRRFVREAQAASSLEHSNICAIYEIDETPDGRMFIVMPCYEGESLQTAIEGGPMDLGDAVDVALQVASGLAKAHEKGIVHRDIKPGNIFLTSDGVAKIVDFGLAKLSGQTKLTRTGSAPGTVSYMSPEQLKGGDVDHRSDIWALGVVLYEMITGETPFRGEYEHAMSYSILNEEPKPLRTFRPDASAEMERLIERALVKDPNGRYQKTNDLVGALQSLRKRVEASAAEVGGGAEKAVPSIAVLPFANMSPDPENQYFGDGLAEELINALTQVKGLHVAARTSAFRFRGENADIREIGEKLNVRTVLEGSVRKAGTRLRVTAQLIDIEDGFHVWSKRFDKEMRDIFDIQDEIARAIVDELKIELVGPKDRILVSCCTENLDAYSAFLEGRYYWNSLTPEGWAKSLDLYQRAIELDPSFALPHAWLAQHYGSQVFWANVAPGEFMPKARSAAKRALELDDTLAVAHAQLANVHWLFDWDLVAAEREFKRAFELEPGSTSALGRTTYALFLALRGRKEEAVREAKLSLKLDPLSSLVAAWAGGALYCVGQIEEAIKVIRRAIAMDPGHWQLHFHAGVGYLLGSMEKEATDAFGKAVDLSKGVSAAQAFLAAACYLTGKRDEADRLTEHLNELAERVYVAPFLFAYISAARGEPEAALAHLERAVHVRDAWLDFLTVMPPRIRVSGPEVDALLKKAGLR